MLVDWSKAVHAVRNCTRGWACGGQLDTRRTSSLSGCDCGRRVDAVVIRLIVSSDFQGALGTLAATVAISAGHVCEKIFYTTRIRHHTLEATLNALVMSPKPHLMLTGNAGTLLGVGEGCPKQHKHRIVLLACTVTAKSRLKLTHFVVCAHDTVRVHGRVFVVIRTSVLYIYVCAYVRLCLCVRVSVCVWCVSMCVITWSAANGAYAVSIAKLFALFSPLDLAFAAIAFC